MSSPQPPAAESPQPQQWACHVCGQAILPPGNPGKVDIAGEHYCDACAELAVLSAPESPGSGTRVVPGRRSSGGVRPTRGSAGFPTSRRSSTAMATPHRMPGSWKGSAVPAWLNMVKPLVILALLGGGGYWIVTRKLTAKPEVEAEVKEEEPDTTRGTKSKAGAKKEEKGEPVKKRVVTGRTSVPARVTTPDVSRDPDVPAPPTEPPPPPAPEVREADLVAGIQRVVTLVKESRYGAARQQLRELASRHEGKEWWGKHEKDWSQISEEWKQQWKDFQEEASDARDTLQEKPTRESIERVLEGWRPYAESDDELVGELAKQILHEAARARIAVIEEARNKRVQQVEEKLTEYEKLMSNRPGSRQQDEMLAFLAELDEEILANPKWEDRLAPRVIGLRFDVKRARDGDLLIYRAVTRPRGSNAELLYDFETRDQFSGWSYSQPDAQETNSRAMWDAESKSVVLRAEGSHDWKGKERQGMPFLCLPMDFVSWSVEVEVEVREIGSTNPPADFGLLVWEGGKNVFFFGFREQANKKGVAEWLFKADGCLDKDSDYEKEYAHITVPENKRVKLFMGWAGGGVSYGAAMGSRPLGTQQRIRLPFKANFLGLYIRSRGGGASVASFDNVKIIGLPNAQALRAKADVSRQVEVNTAKEDWRKQAQAARVARDLAAGAIPKEWHADWTCPDAKPCTLFPERPNARQTSPLNPAALPCWSRRVKLAPYKTHYVHADLSAPQGTDWGVAVRVNGKEVASQVVTGPEWQMLDVDLTPYGGEEVLLEISHRPAGNPDGEMAYWDRIYVGNR